MRDTTNGETSEYSRRIGEIVERALAEAILSAGCLDRYGAPKCDEQLQRRELLAQRAARRLLRRGK